MAIYKTTDKRKRDLRPQKLAGAIYEPPAQKEVSPETYAALDTMSGGEQTDLTQYSPGLMQQLQSLQRDVGQPFAYEAARDPLYAPLKEQYETAGKRAFEDVIGRLSALTGGRPSTAAIGTAQAGQQQYTQEFAGQVLPQLAGQAYERYQTGLKNRLSMLEAGVRIEDEQYRRTMEAEEMEWSRSADNPAVRTKLLANEIQELKLQTLPEELKMGLAQQEAELSHAQTVAKYAPAEANARLEQIRASVRATEQSIIERQQKAIEDKEKAEAAIPPTPEQYANYNEVKYRLLRPDNTQIRGDPSQALRHIGGMGKKLYTDLMGENLYNQLVEGLQEQATAPEEEEVDTSAIEKTISGLFSDKEKITYIRHSRLPEGEQERLIAQYGLTGEDNYSQAVEAYDAEDKEVAYKEIRDMKDNIIKQLGGDEDLYKKLLKRYK